VRLVSLERLPLRRTGRAGKDTALPQSPPLSVRKLTDFPPRGADRSRVVRPRRVSQIVCDVQSATPSGSGDPDVLVEESSTPWLMSWTPPVASDADRPGSGFACFRYGAKGCLQGSSPHADSPSPGPLPLTRVKGRGNAHILAFGSPHHYPVRRLANAEICLWFAVIQQSSIKSPAVVGGARSVVPFPGLGRVPNNARRSLPLQVRQRLYGPPHHRYSALLLPPLLQFEETGYKCSGRLRRDDLMAIKISPRWRPPSPQFASSPALSAPVGEGLGTPFGLILIAVRDDLCVVRERRSDSLSRKNKRKSRFCVGRGRHGGRPSPLPQESGL
jgi:hypothetical protein